MVLARVAHAELAKARYGELFDRMTTALERSDVLADRAVEALEESPRGWASLEALLAQGPAAAGEVPREIKDLVDDAASPPAFVDWRRVHRGGAVMLRAGLLGGLVLGARSLIAGYAAPAGNKPLVLSGRLVERAPRRLAETARFVQAVSLPFGMSRYEPGFAITLMVRVMHARVRRLCVRDPRWEGRWGLPINQHDMAATVLLFSHILLGGLEHLGMEVSEEEGEDFLHLWRYVGHAMGVEPGLLPESRAEAERIGRFIELTQGEPDDDSRALVKAFFESPLLVAKTPAERRAAMARVRVNHALCRHLVGDTYADVLAVPRVRGGALALRGVRALVARVERATRPLPASFKAEVGRRHWERIVELSLRGVPASYAPPPRLGSA